MSLNTGSAKLSFALKTLHAKWHRAESEWSDKVRKDFETNYLTPVETELLATLNAINGLAQILAKAEQECS